MKINTFANLLLLSFFIQDMESDTITEPLQAIIDKLQEYQDGPLTERRARLSRLFNVEPGHRTPVPAIEFPISDR